VLHSGIKVALAAGLALWASSASAATFTGTYTETGYNSTGANGTKISIQNSQSGLNFDLAVLNQQTTIDLFDISIRESINLREDLKSNPLYVNFSFTQPSLSSGTVEGSTKGVFRWYGADLVVSWAAPLIFNFGDGLKLKVALADIKIPQLLLLFDAPRTVQGTFTLTDVPSVGAGTETPIPAALPLFASGVAGLGMINWRRKRKAKLALK